ncbi:Molybdenum cofactor sulfurase [Chlorella sorokiniana]|uniref:Molybdenum cofactor sulfurase n=1 Tax=Chlorella sorokiniana TaxID=3076 RepID=A0A2P6TCU0_CHLSO|nr:Molybdenum cofactor sulfurase [Chlorella sorokiniana]|eukprot:PRW20464.1 Molybdenum cofactor sulfurase [Chlorella sorokiniana]
MLGHLLCLLGLLGAATACGEPCQAAKAVFLSRWGDAYGYGGRIDEIWAKEIGTRLPPDEHYIDFTGSSLYWNSQVEGAMRELQTAVFGNPHSSNPSSLRTEARVEELRRRVLDFFGADPSIYDIVWTRSGTGALHILGETFPFTPGSRFAYLDSNHNSVLGIREYAKLAGAEHGAVSEAEVEAWLAGEPGASLPPILQEDGKAGHPKRHHSKRPRLEAAAADAAAAAAPGGRRQLAAQPAGQQGLALALEELGDPLDLEQASGTGRQHGRKHHSGSGGGGSGGSSGEPGEGGDKPGEAPVLNLFAFPGMDNFGGVMYPLRWVRAVQAKSTRRQRWKVLLDAAAFVPSHPLNLTETPADFVDMSMYKLFGYPTGVGALIARHEDIAAARKLYWGGGSVFLATSHLDWRLLRPCGAERFEDGTLPFLNILGLSYGLDVYNELGWANIERHTNAIREWLYSQLPQLRHSNGAPMLRVLGNHSGPDSSWKQGATFNFQILKPNGEVFSYRRAGTAMVAAGFHMRTGCTCNPGACYAFLGVRDEEVQTAAQLAQGNFSEWEWVWVRRKVDTPHAIPTAEEAAAHAGSVVANEGKHHQLVKLPLGSLRLSFGYMSRFEDAWALLNWLKQHYTDRTVDDYVFTAADGDSSSSGSGNGGDDAAGAAGTAAGRTQRRAEHVRRVIELQGPGWC